MTLPAPTLTTEELDILEDFLLDDDREDTPTLDMLQGFLVAIASGPEAVPEHVWLTAALGDPQWSSPEEQEAILDLIRRLNDEVVQALTQGEEIPFLVPDFDEEDPNPDYAGWCLGYWEGVHMLEDRWFQEGGDELVELMVPVMVLSGIYEEGMADEGTPIPEDELAQTVAESMEALPGVVNDIYDFWMERRAH